MPVASHVCSGSYRRSESCPMGFLFPTQVLRFPRRTEIAGLEQALRRAEAACKSIPPGCGGKPALESERSTKNRMTADSRFADYSTRLGEFIRRSSSSQPSGTLGSIRKADQTRFNELALELFALQYESNPPYQRFCSGHGEIGRAHV